MVLLLPLPVSFPFSRTAVKDDLLGISTLLLLNCVYSVCQPWLYFVIPRQGYKDGCPAKIFLYAPIDLYNPHWVGFTKFSAILACLFGAFGVPFVCIMVLHGVLDGVKKPGTGGWTLPHILAEPLATLTGEDAPESDTSPHDTPDEETKKKQQKKFWKIYVFAVKTLLGFGGASSIAFIEETIRVNHIALSDAPLSATSQLIPFIVGIFSLSAVSWNGFKQWRAGGAEEEEDKSPRAEHDGA